MIDHLTEWPQVGRTVAQRIDQLGLTKAEVIRRSGVSDKTLDRYLAGEAIVRRDKRVNLSLALGWTADSIDRLARGDTAVEVPNTEPRRRSDQQGPGQTLEDLRLLKAVVTRHEGEIDRLRDLLRDLAFVVESIAQGEGEGAVGDASYIGQEAAWPMRGTGVRPDTPRPGLALAAGKGNVREPRAKKERGTPAVGATPEEES